MRRLLLLTAVLAAAGCSQPKEEPPQPEIVRVNTGDGVVVKEEHDAPSATDRMVRCWPTATKQDCVFVYFSGGERLSSVTVRRVLLDDVPVTPVFPEIDEGALRYECEVGWRGSLDLGIWYVEQEILRGYSRLTSRQAYDSSDPLFKKLWSKEFVEDWGDNNAAPDLGRQFVDCLAIGKLLSEGSWATLETSMLTDVVNGEGT